MEQYHVIESKAHLDRVTIGKSIFVSVMAPDDVFYAKVTRQVAREILEFAQNTEPWSSPEHGLSHAGYELEVYDAGNGECFLEIRPRGTSVAYESMLPYPLVYGALGPGKST